MSDQAIWIPGLPIKRNNPCVDPEQKPIPHIQLVSHIKEDENGNQYLAGDSYEANLEDYPEYKFVIDMFIQQHLTSIQTQNEVWIVTTNCMLAAKDQYQVFTDKEKAITKAKELGYKDQFGLGINENIGILNLYQEGKEYVALMKTIIQ